VPNPRFSLVVPAFNVERYVERCLRSLVHQTLPAAEILVYDDGSTDGTAAIAERFAAKHPNVRLTRQSNTGQGAIRNRGIREASGDYLVFVDSDDELDRRALERIAARIGASLPDVVAFRFQSRYPFRIGGGSSRWDELIAGRDELVGQDTELLLTNRWLAPWQAAYRLEFVRHHGLRNGEGYIFEDQEFTAGGFIAAERASLVDDALYLYHFNASSSLREKSHAAQRRRIEGRRRSRQALVALVARLGASDRARALLADHDVHDTVQEVVSGIYSADELTEVLADVTEFLNGLEIRDAAWLSPGLAQWHALPPGERDSTSVERLVARLAVAERARVARTIAFRLANAVAAVGGRGYSVRSANADQRPNDPGFAAVFRSFPHRMLRRLGTAAGPVVRGVRRLLGGAS